MSSQATSVSDLTSPTLMDQLLEDIPEVDHGDTNPVEDEVDLDLGSVEEMDIQTGTKITACIVTIFPSDQNGNWLLPSTYGINADHLNHWCGQFEICPDTENLHAHIFIKFVNKYRPRFNELRTCFANKLEKGLNIKPGKPSVKNMQRMINYCLKPDKGAIPDTQFILSGYENIKKTAFDEAVYFAHTALSKRDARKKEIIDYIESKPWHWTWDQIVHETEDSKLLLFGCSDGKTFHQGRKTEQPRRSIDQVVLLFGAAGTGKTTYALALGADHGLPPNLTTYTRNFEEDKFWGSGVTAYNNHPWILCEEFKGQETFSKLKQYTDIGKHGPAVAIKGSGTHLNHEGIVFASNYHPGTWYRNVWKTNPVHWKAFYRRVTKVLFFPEFCPNGTVNRPGTEEQPEPYFEDMTDEFKEDFGDYETAWDAFQSVWPTNEDDFSNGEHLDIPEAKRQRR